MRKIGILLILISLVYGYELKEAVVVTARGKSSSSSYRLSSSVGQFIVGKSASAGYNAYIGFWNRKFYQTGVSEETGPVVYPLKLYQSVPNPAIGQVSIAFSLSGRSEVKILVYDVSGKLVRRLVEGEYDGGYYVVRWDLRDERGHEIPSGVYFYTMYSGKYRETKKLMVIKGGRVSVK